MRYPVLAALLALIPLLGASSDAHAQGAVAFQPVVSAFPNGITMGVTPVVSADRRYVRIGVQPQFVALNGFETFTIPAAVQGGVANGAIGAPGAGAGFPSVGLGPNMGPGYQVPRFSPSFQTMPTPQPTYRPQPRARSKAKTHPRRP